MYFVTAPPQLELIDREGAVGVEPQDPRHLERTDPPAYSPETEGHERDTRSAQQLESTDEKDTSDSESEKNEQTTQVQGETEKGEPAPIFSLTAKEFDFNARFKQTTTRTGRKWATIDALATRAYDQGFSYGVVAPLLGSDGSDGRHGCDGFPGSSGSSGHSGGTGNRGGDGGHGSCGEPGSSGAHAQVGTRALDGVFSITWLNTGLSVTNVTTGMNLAVLTAEGLDRLMVKARGGDGGNGGRGGHGGSGGSGGRGGSGGSGASGHSASGYGQRGGDGGNGGNGGRGGNGGSGGRGADAGNGGHSGGGGHIVFRVEDPRILVVCEVDCRHGTAGIGGALGRGGDGGSGGSGGHGGSGGSGGSGGPSKSETYTDDEGFTHSRTVISAGSSGSSGSSGSDGRSGSRGCDGADGRRGADGRTAPHGKVQYVVCTGSGVVVDSQSDRFNCSILAYDMFDENNDDIFEPDSLVEIGNVRFGNNGAMPLPQGSKLTFYSSKLTLVPPPESHQLREVVVGGFDFVPTDEVVFRLQIPDAKKTVDAAFSAQMQLSSRVTMLGRQFADCEVSSTLHIQWPLRVSQLECPSLMSPGEVVEVLVTVTNISKAAYGFCESSSGTVAATVTLNECLHIGTPLGPKQQTLRFDMIPAGESRQLSFTVAMHPSAIDSVYTYAPVLVSLELRGKEIECHNVNERGIRVVPAFDPTATTDIVVVTHKDVTRNEFLAWCFLLEAFKFSANFWDVEKYGGLRTSDMSWVGHCRNLWVISSHADTRQSLLLSDVTQHMQNSSDNQIILCGWKPKEYTLFMYDFSQPIATVSKTKCGCPCVLSAAKSVEALRRKNSLANRSHHYIAAKAEGNAMCGCCRVQFEVALFSSLVAATKKIALLSDGLISELRNAQPLRLPGFTCERTAGGCAEKAAVPLNAAFFNRLVTLLALSFPIEEVFEMSCIPYEEVYFCANEQTLADGEVDEVPVDYSDIPTRYSIQDVIAGAVVQAYISPDIRIAMFHSIEERFVEGGEGLNIYASREVVKALKERGLHYANYAPLVVSAYVNVLLSIAHPSLALPFAFTRRSAVYQTVYSHLLDLCVHFDIGFPVQWRAALECDAWYLHKWWTLFQVLCFYAFAGLRSYFVFTRTNAIGVLILGILQMILAMALSFGMSVAHCNFVQFKFVTVSNWLMNLLLTAQLCLASFGKRDSLWALESDASVFVGVALAVATCGNDLVSHMQKSRCLLVYQWTAFALCMLSLLGAAYLGYRSDTAVGKYRAIASLCAWLVAAVAVVCESWRIERRYARRIHSAAAARSNVTLSRTPLRTALLAIFLAPLSPMYAWFRRNREYRSGGMAKKTDAPIGAEDFETGEVGSVHGFDFEGKSHFYLKIVRMFARNGLPLFPALETFEKGVKDWVVFDASEIDERQQFQQQLEAAFRKGHVRKHSVVSVKQL